MWVWVILRPIPSASLSNSALHLKRESKKPRISLQTRVWVIPRSDWDTGLSHASIQTRGPRPVRDPCFCYNWHVLLGQLTPHVMWELIPIMENFYGTIIPLWLSINNLRSYEIREDFGERKPEKRKKSFDWELRILKLKASCFPLARSKVQREEKKNNHWSLNT